MPRLFKPWYFLFFSIEKTVEICIIINSKVLLFMPQEMIIQQAQPMIKLKY